jgi:hypothetical protein
MATNSVPEVEILINKQLAFQEKVQEYLTKTEAIANVALSEDFLDFEKSVIHAYLWALCDMIAEMKRHNECALDELLKNNSNPCVSL